MTVLTIRQTLVPDGIGNAGSLSLLGASAFWTAVTWHRFGSARSAQLQPSEATP